MHILASIHTHYESYYYSSSRVVHNVNVRMSYEPSPFSQRFKTPSYALALLVLRSIFIHEHFLFIFLQQDLRSS